MSQSLQTPQLSQNECLSGELAAHSVTTCHEKIENEANDNINKVTKPTEILEVTKPAKLTRYKACKTVACAFLGYTVFAYQVSSFGIYYIILTEVFSSSRAIAGWVGSLDIALRYITGKLPHYISVELLDLWSFLITISFIE